GSIFITLNSPAAFQIGDLQQVRAEAGEIAGDGGHITVRNSGLGGIDVTNLNFSRISVAAPGGSGGSIEPDAGFWAIAGPLAFPKEGGTLAAVGGAGAGGSITLRGSTTNLSSLQNSLTLDVSGTTTGGSISVTTTDSSANADITLGVNPGQVDLTTGGVQGSGSITVNSGHDIIIANGLTSGNVLLAASHGGSITQGPGIFQILASSATLTSDTGNIGTSLTPIETGVANLTLETGGTGNVFVHQRGAVVLEDSRAGGDFFLTSTAQTTVNDITAVNGSLTVSNDTGALLVNTVSAGGQVTLTAEDGFLTIDANVTANSSNIILAANSISLAPSTNVQASGNIMMTTAHLNLGAGSL